MIFVCATLISVKSKYGSCSGSCTGIIKFNDIQKKECNGPAVRFCNILVLMLSIMLLLCSNAVAIRRDKSILYSRSAIAIILCCIIICLNSYYTSFIGKGIGLFSGLYQVTLITHVFHIFVFIVTGLILQLNSFHARKIWVSSMGSIYTVLFCKIIFFNKFIQNKMGEQYRILEYPLIILFVVMGGGLLMSSCDLITIFLSIELQSYGLYILCAIYRNSEQATTGGLMYFLLGGLSSCFILLGASLIYGNSGNTSFDGIYVINNISNSNIDYEGNGQLIYNSWYDSYYIHFCLAILSVGFLFKISAAPFHFWSPDVYDAIPTIVTTFVAIFAKISILIMLLELVHYTTNIFSLEPSSTTFGEVSYRGASGYSWTSTILISSLLSLIIGATLGLTQIRIKRLYAYSTVSHIGFILLALAINSVESIQSFIFYIMQYSLSNLNAFLLLIAIGYSLYAYVEEKKINKKQHKNEDEKAGEISRISDSSNYSNELFVDKNNSPVQFVKQLKGYFYINPVLSLSLAITIFSFVGIPPLVGFFAKQMILSSALDNGYVFMALVAILTSVISAYYYLAIVKQIFFDKTDYVINPSLNSTFINASIVSYSNARSVENLEVKVDDIKLTGFLSTTISVLSLVILLFILVPQEWLSMANILALVLFND